MPSVQTLMNGRIQFRLAAEDRRLLKELVRQKNQGIRGCNRPVNEAKILVPLMREWCRNPENLAAVKIRGTSVRLDVRALDEDEKIAFREFAEALVANEKTNASAILAGVLRKHLEPRRKALEDDARRFADLERRRRLRVAARRSLGAAIDEFLDASRELTVSRAVLQVGRDADALVRLGHWVAQRFVAVENARKQLVQRTEGTNRALAFADELKHILTGGQLARSELISMGQKPGSNAKT